MATFYSRSRKGRWCKGETSGHYIGITGVYADCDADSLVYLGEPIGPACHTVRPVKSTVSRYWPAAALLNGALHAGSQNLLVQAAGAARGQYSGACAQQWCSAAAAAGCLAAADPAGAGADHSAALSAGQHTRCDSCTADMPPCWGPCHCGRSSRAQCCVCRRWQALVDCQATSRPSTVVQQGGCMHMWPSLLHRLLLSTAVRAGAGGGRRAVSDS